MTILQRFSAILFEPDYATFDLHHSPRVGEAFIIVSIYAVISGLNSFLSGYSTTDTLMIGIIAMIAAVCIIFLIWVIISIAFHVIAGAVGGKGEFINAFGYVGIATTPLILVATISLILTLVTITGLLAEYAEVLQYVNLGSKVIGMAWGMPGIVCYYGMKNAERLDSLKAIIITMFFFFILAGLEIFSSALIG